MASDVLLRHRARDTHGSLELGRAYRLPGSRAAGLALQAGLRRHCRRRSFVSRIVDDAFTRRPGNKVLLKPQPEGFYIAEGKFFPFTLFSLRLAPETPKARDSGESTGLPALMDREPAFSCSILSCAGLKHPIYTALRLPVEVRVAAAA
jgi:hypothetical protein